MAGPERALPGGADQGRLRASHADRNGVIRTLKSAYVLGYVTKDEFDARLSQTLAARTYAELARVTTDLPASLRAAQPEPVPASASAPVRPVDRAIVGLALLAATSFAAAIFSADGWLAFGAFGSALASLFLVAIQAGTARRPQLPGGQVPGGQPARSRAGGSGMAGGSAPEPPRAIEPGRPGDVRPPSRRRPRPLLSC
jgi:hypothetical protein